MQTEQALVDKRKRSKRIMLHICAELAERMRDLTFSLNLEAKREGIVKANDYELQKLSREMVVDGKKGQPWIFSSPLCDGCGQP